MQKYTIWDFNDKPVHINPEMVFPMLDYFCEDMCNIIAEYCSQYLDLEIAKEICSAEYPDWGQAAATAVIVHLAVIDPDKVIRKGIQISQQKDIMKKNIHKWIEKINYKTSWELFYYVLRYFDEPAGFPGSGSLYFASKKMDKKVRVWLTGRQNKEKSLIYYIVDGIYMTLDIYNALINCNYKDICTDCQNQNGYRMVFNDAIKICLFENDLFV